MVTSPSDPPAGDREAATGTGTTAVRVRFDGPVMRLTLCRPERYNTITPRLREELDAALDVAERSRDVKVVLVDHEGRAFCAGYDLGWGTAAQAAETGPAGSPSPGTGRVWDSVADLRMIGRYARTWARLSTIPKPTICAVGGWCVAGGVNLAFCADLIVAGRSAVFGYPPVRVWGIPEHPWTWVARLGLERAKRMLFTGDELTGPEAARIGAVVDCVPDDQLEATALGLAHRIGQLPLNQLEMVKLVLSDVARHMYDPERSTLLGALFDGVARHTAEGLAFVETAQRLGFREAVRLRDRPFGDYGERPR